MNQPQQRTAPDKPYNAGDEEQVAERKKQTNTRAAQAARGLAKIMDDPDCRAWMYQQIADAQPFGDPFTGSSQTFYNCGRQIGAKLLINTLLDKHLDAYVLMNKEAKNG